MADDMSETELGAQPGVSNSVEKSLTFFVVICIMFKEYNVYLIRLLISFLYSFQFVSH